MVGWCLGFERQIRQGGKSEIMRKICFQFVHVGAVVLWLITLCSNTGAQTPNTGTSKAQNPRATTTCTKDSECPSGQRCGFTGGCQSKGKCIVPSGDSHCIDPGGRCGCDGRPVDIFCGGVNGDIAFTSAPVNAVGPCPRPCTKEIGCGTSGLVCQNGFCVKP